MRQLTKRFLEVLDKLVEEHAADNMKMICVKLGYQQQNLSQLREGKREVTLLLIMRLYQEFHGNPVYILLGEGDKILTDQKLNTQKSKLSEDANAGLVKRLEELVESKNDYIALLKKENERLTIELDSKEKYIALLKKENERLTIELDSKEK